MNDLDQGQTPSTPVSPVSKAERARLAREALVGKSIASGRYVLRALLGHGGMGAVYEGEHTGIGKKVAIKFVDSEWVSDEQVLTRFAREAKAMSTVESPHIVSIFDAGTEEGRPYLVMELLRGEDLGQRLRRTSRVPLAEALHIMAMVLKGLSKAHAAGIVHRDLKPDNIFLVQHDPSEPVLAKIVDFGVSKIERPRNRTSPLALTGRGTVLGTPFYMSPEQAQAAPDLDGRADLFSVGTILFECLSGRPPFTGETYEQIILAICMRDAPPLTSIDASVPDAISKFVEKALARDRTQRFSSADEMLAALQALSPDAKKRAAADEPPTNKTMIAGAGSVSPISANPNVTAPTPTSVKPFKGASTAIAGSNVDATAQATPVGAQQAAAVLQQTPGGTIVSPLANSGNVGSGSMSAVPTSGRTSTTSSVPSRTPPRSSAVIATAVVAALLGVVATFAIISVVSNKAPPSSSAAPTISSASPASSAPPAPKAVLTPLPSAEPLESAIPAPALAPAPAPSPSPSPKSTLAPLPAAPKPKPSANKSLDISRDLP